MYPYSFQGFPQQSHYPYSPHFGYEQAGLEQQYRTGDLSDVTPLGVIVPPLGIAQAFGGSRSTSSSTPKRPSRGIPWSTIALIGILAGGALAVYTIYRGTKASEPLLRKAGEGAARALASRYGAGAFSERKTILPPVPKPKLLAAAPQKWPPRPPVPRTKANYTIRTLPEYEAYR
jgi:hypothetical protein